MTLKTSLALLILLTPVAPALAQVPPPSPGGILSNPDAPRPSPPANPTGAPPLPTIMPSTILTPGSGR